MGRTFLSAKLFVSSKLHQKSTHIFGARWLNTSYFQGQSPELKIREYFYFMDHQGMLYLDDSLMKNFTSCFKDKQFLKFFISRITRNTLGRYVEFPYVSLCGRERNYLRCDDVPIIFTHMLDEQSSEPLMSYGHCDRLLTVGFQPEKICVVPSTGRVYHPARDKICGLGLVSDKLSVLWSEERRFVFENGDEEPPTHFLWRNKKVQLTNELLPEIKSLKLDRRR